MDDLKPIPLARHKLFEISDLDEARDHVARVFCPHKLVPSGRRAAPAIHNSVDLGGLSLNYMTYGSDVRIDPGELERVLPAPDPAGGHRVGALWNPDDGGVHPYGDSALAVPGRSDLSRFAVSYRQRYHESPSETLRRGGPSFD